MSDNIIIDDSVTTEILVKSEKISPKKKKLGIWLIAVLMLITAIVFFAIDYSGYRKGQEFGLSALMVSYAMSDTDFINENDSYKEKCETFYRKLNSRTPDITYDGITYDASYIRETENALRSSFAEIMESAGYDRYGTYDIANWFRYANIFEYFIGHFCYQVIPIVCYTVFILAIILTLLINREAKKELVVYTDSVLCKINAKKSKQLNFEDINVVEFKKKTLKLSGIGIKFKIANITNAENIKSIIIDKKNSIQIKLNNEDISNIDKLKKYKDLLDSGVILQEEFDAKKKQLLGL